MIDGNKELTTCISCNNNLHYLKWAIVSVRDNYRFNEGRIIVHAENCTDGTDEWLEANYENYGVDAFIDHNDSPKGIGGGMDFCAGLVETEFLNIIHADMYVGKDADVGLLNLFEERDESVRLVASSYRVQPRIFPNDKNRPGTIFVDTDVFGEYWHNFDYDGFIDFAEEFGELNDERGYVRKGGGAGFMIRKRDYDYIGGNDPFLAPKWWEDMDLFSRMQMEGYDFIMTPKSVVWHFSARSSHFPDDNFNQRSNSEIEQYTTQRFIQKWGRFPTYDDHTFVIPIDNPNIDTRLTDKEPVDYSTVVKELRGYNG